MFGYFRDIRRGLLYLSDLRRAFAENSTGFVEFLGDAMAVSLSQEDLENLNELVKIAVVLPNLRFRMESGPKPETAITIPQIPPGVAAIFQMIATTGKISPSSLKALAEAVGFEVGGKAGRPPKDYSREYELKKRMSWAEVARQMLLEDSELRAEFGTDNYDSLDFERQEVLSHRIREGVKSYAKRSGNPTVLTFFLLTVYADTTADEDTKKPGSGRNDDLSPPDRIGIGHISPPNYRRKAST